MVTMVLLNQFDDDAIISNIPYHASVTILHNPSVAFVIIYIKPLFS